ncbi:fibrinogen-like protein A [Physella acuta]|uniref:fibrinogen-like protein A n=1 Tax=Physella acuta TaxID=109671 RepID=UPI0027DC907F|nr:fibrinogen-like protein A [Physella acuta]
MFFTAVLSALLSITLLSLCPCAEHQDDYLDKRQSYIHNAPRCSARRCLSAPEPVCLKSKMFPCYADVEPMRALGKTFLCDTKTDQGGWIFIQRRTVGDISFDQTWARYKAGFGSLSGDFWIGNDFLYGLTSAHNYELRIDMNYNGRPYHAVYGTFYVGSEAAHYTLQVSQYSGNAGDSMSIHNNQRFTTTDRPTTNGCTASYKAGWWFADCYRAFLNGKWEEEASFDGIHWESLGDDPLQRVEMRIRRKGA